MTIELMCGIIYSGKLLRIVKLKEVDYAVMQPSELSKIQLYMPINEVKRLISERFESYENESYEKYYEILKGCL